MTEQKLINTDEMLKLYEKIDSVQATLNRSNIELANLTEQFEDNLEATERNKLYCLIKQNELLSAELSLLAQQMYLYANTGELYSI